MGTPFHLLFTFRYAIFLPLAILEGPIITVVAAYMASLKLFNVFAIYGLAVLGDVIGDLLHYAAGRIGRDRFIPKYGRWAGLTQTRIDQADRHFQAHLGKTILFGKYTQAPNSLILILAGATRSDLRRFLAVATLASLPKVLAFTLVGYFLGKHHAAIVRTLNRSILVSAILLGLAALVFAWQRHARKTWVNP